MKKIADLIEDYQTVKRLHGEIQADPPLPEQIDSDSRVSMFMEYYMRAGLSVNDIGGFGDMVNWIKENSPRRYRASARIRQKQRQRNWLQRVQ